MSALASRVRAVVEPSGSVAEIHLLLQPSPDVTVPWRWDLPYPLWASWGTPRAARWIADQFHQHDRELSCAVGFQAVYTTLTKALEVHKRFFRVGWLSGMPA